MKYALTCIITSWAVPVVSVVLVVGGFEGASVPFVSISVHQAYNYKIICKVKLYTENKRKFHWTVAMKLYFHSCIHADSNKFGFTQWKNCISSSLLQSLRNKKILFHKMSRPISSYCIEFFRVIICLIKCEKKLVQGLYLVRCSLLKQAAQNRFGYL